MEPWDKVRERLPEHLRLTLKAKYLELWCDRCRDLVAAVPRDRATPGEILEAARMHRCPGQEEGGP